MSVVARLRPVAVAVALWSCAPPDGPPEVGTSTQALAGSMKLSAVGNHFWRADDTPVWLLGMATCCDEPGDPALDNGWPWISEHWIEQVRQHGGNWVTIRTGPQTAAGEAPAFEGYLPGADGRYDTAAFNDDYFVRLRQRIAYAQGLGVYVEVDLIDAWNLENGHESPWKIESNSGGVDLRCRRADGTCSGVLDGDLDPVQVAWIQRVIDATGDLDNVLYQISNEPYDCEGCGSTPHWEAQVAAIARARLAANGMPGHLIATNVDTDAPVGAADYVNLHRSQAVAVKDGKPTGVNEGGSDTPVEPAAYADALWRGFANGTFYHYWWGELYEPGRVAAVLARMQAFRRVIDHVQFGQFAPANQLDGDWLVTGDGVEWIGYWAGGGSSGQDVPVGDGGRFAYTWYEVEHGFAIESGEADAGAVLRLDPPDGPVVVHVVRIDDVIDPCEVDNSCDPCNHDEHCDADAGETADNCPDDCDGPVCKPAAQSFSVSEPRIATYGITFSADLSAITPGSTPLWDLGTGDHREGSPLTVAYQAAGTYTVVLTSNDVSCGTTVLTVQTITVEPQPAVSCADVAAQIGWTYQGCGVFGDNSCDNLPGTYPIGTGWDCVLAACCASPPPTAPSCGELGGDYCHDVPGTCPWPYLPIGPSLDCKTCCDAPPPYEPTCDELGGDYCSPSAGCPTSHDDLGPSAECARCCKYVPPPQPSCGELGGEYCSPSWGWCPDGYDELGPTSDCATCCDDTYVDPCASDAGHDHSGQCGEADACGHVFGAWDECGCPGAPIVYDTCWDYRCDSGSIWVDEYCTGSYWTNDWCEDCWNDCHFENYDEWVCDWVCGTVGCNYEEHFYEYVCGGHWEEVPGECHWEPYACNPHPCE